MGSGSVPGAVGLAWRSSVGLAGDDGEELEGPAGCSLGGQAVSGGRLCWRSPALPSAEHPLAPKLCAAQESGACL